MVGILSHPSSSPSLSPYPYSCPYHRLSQASLDAERRKASALDAKEVPDVMDASADAIGIVTKDYVTL